MKPPITSKYLNAEERAQLDMIAEARPELAILQDKISAYLLEDGTKLDEIDARATAFLQCLPYGYHDREPGTGAVRLWAGRGEPVICAKLSRSRDALQAARPQGWWFRQVEPRSFQAVFMKDGWYPIWPIKVQGLCATREELCELSCLLMVVDLERHD